MTSISLQEEIAARVRIQLRALGPKRFRTQSVVRVFQGRASDRALEDAVKVAMRELTARGEAQNTAAPALLRPHEMINCLPKKMNLTRAGCARLWTSARNARPNAWEGRAACVGCQAGAANAGYRASPVAGLVDLLSKTCPRCLKSASKLINGRFCVSCYNRDCEARRGRNARGGRPRLCSRLGRRSLVKSNASGVQVVSADLAVGATELLLIHAAMARDELAFGWAPRGPGDEADLS